MHFMRLALEGMTPGHLFDNGKTWQGPELDFVLLYGSRKRLINFEKTWTTCFIITPAVDNEDGGRVVGRNDRRVQFIVSGFAQLNDKEQKEDPTKLPYSEVLPIRIDCLVADFKTLFYSNLNFISAACPRGMVDDATMNIEWIEEAEWPMAAFAATIDCMTSEYWEGD